ncbi:MAG: DUF1002 domain-containing protein [Oscillospiraceae bacterium]|nr:DUF1002 domain-containing protein [Oscillospiraceae bacterium]
MNMKRIISVLLVFALLAGLGTHAAAVEVGEQRVVLGADLNAEQRAQVLNTFGLAPGHVPEMTVTIEQERAYLQGFVSDSVIGTRSISSIYIMTLPPGSGLDISVSNINWLTEEIYTNALVTAGITDARVIITAPVPVSGTAALTGIYIAFEDISGETLPEEAKLTAVEEAVVTGQIAEQLGDSEDIAALMNELKLILDEIRHMNDNEVRDEIRRLAIEFNIDLTADQVEQILRLARNLQNLDLGALQGTIESIARNWERLAGIGETASGFFGSVAGFFSNIGSAIGNFFSRIFG